MRCEPLVTGGLVLSATTVENGWWSGERWSWNGGLEVGLSLKMRQSPPFFGRSMGQGRGNNDMDRTLLGNESTVWPKCWFVGVFDDDCSYFGNFCDYFTPFSGQSLDYVEIGTPRKSTYSSSLFWRLSLALRFSKMLKIFSKNGLPSWTNVQNSPLLS
jgi:hypothetical protein